MIVNANGATLHVEQDGDGPSAVFVHGMCGDARVWAGQVERLRDQFRCVTYDRRGHSRSPQTDAVDRVELHADDLAALIEVLGLAPTLVVGSSGGARIVVDLIRRHPHLVRGAVLSEPPLGALAPELFAGMIGEVEPKLQAATDAGDPRAAVDGFFEVVCPGLWSRIDEARKDRYRDNAPMLFAELGMPPYLIDPDDIAKIDVPALVVAGSTSHPALRTAARRLAEFLPEVRFLELECGHVTYAEQPDDFARGVAAFASELQASARSQA